jgi:hypothetical protein
MIETLKSLHFQFIYLLHILENCINIKNVWNHFMYFEMQTSKNPTSMTKTNYNDIPNLVI